MRVDLRARAAAQDVDLDDALARLRRIYEDVDARSAKNTAALDLPCKSGCSSCCEESVLLTPLEFYGIWDHLQSTRGDDEIATIVEDALRAYEANKDLIDVLERPPPPGHVDHTRLIRTLRFRCPVLDPGGACRAYPMREILGRLFGCTFNDEGGIYGCDLVGAHLGGKIVTLGRARPHARRVLDLPLTHKQQVIPFYVHELYGKA
jgi:hypothetical protein